MQELVKNNEYVEFLIEFDDGDFEHHASFSVYEVTAWDAETNTCSDADTELYLKGSIKWDGCSHFWFGDKDGYIHLCGKEYFEKHKRVMDAIWDICSKKIKHFDKEVAE